MEVSQCSQNQNSVLENSDELALRKASKHWTPEEWESYLLTLETPIAESQISPVKFARIAENCPISIFDFSQSASSPALVTIIQRALEELTARQRQVVHLIFFKSKSTYETALELGISQSSVRDLKRKAFKNLRTALEGGTLTFPVVEGQFRNGDQDIVPNVERSSVELFKTVKG